MFVLMRLSQTKGIAEYCTISHESTTAVYRNGEPLMLISCQRMHTIYALVKRRNVFIQDAEGTIGSINVQPEALLGAQVGEVIKRIDSPGLHRSCRCGNTERP